MRVTSASSDSSFLTVSAAYNPAKPPPTITTRAAFLRTDVTGSSSEALQSMRVIHEHRPDGRDGDHEDQAHQLRGETPEHDGRILLKVLGLLTTRVEKCAVDEHDQAGQAGFHVQPPSARSAAQPHIPGPTVPNPHAPPEPHQHPAPPRSPPP